MSNQKLDNLLNLAEKASEQELKKSLNLGVGFDERLCQWDVIVKYSGDAAALKDEGITVVPLLGGFAVVTLAEDRLEHFSKLPQVEFIEKPKRMYFEEFRANQASCITEVQEPAFSAGRRSGLTGKGVLVGIVDSGVDYRHPDFRNEDGSTRILRLWDQSGTTGKPPAGYVAGTEYTQEEINRALSLSENEGQRLVPQKDYSGHGTSVLGIAAGNGRESVGGAKGVAYESGLLVVKLGNPKEDSFPRTTELMQGIDYLVRQALALKKPLAINISFGNNYGSHRGDSLLETYIDQVAEIGKMVICTGTGNNGGRNLHAGGCMKQGEVQEIEFGVSPCEPLLNVQLWKSYADQMEVFIESPSGERIGPLKENLGAQRYRLGDTELFIYYGKPGPFQLTQEIYVDFIPEGEYIDYGVWKLILEGSKIKEGEYFLWLPGGKTLNPQTGFYFSRAAGTLTIPSAAARAITVGAYDFRRNIYADFSGRGSRLLSKQKPDLVAPGVEITAPVPGGRYGKVTGTSFAVPFVTGASALMMEWGIVQKNDPFLWGEKVKAYLRRGAKPLLGYQQYPNPEVGYGALCLRESFPLQGQRSR